MFLKLHLEYIRLLEQETQETDTHHPLCIFCSQGFLFDLHLEDTTKLDDDYYSIPEPLLWSYKE